MTLKTIHPARQMWRNTCWAALGCVFYGTILTATAMWVEEQPWRYALASLPAAGILLYIGLIFLLGAKVAEKEDMST